MYWYNKSAVLEVRIPSQDFFLKWNRNILKTRMHRNEVQAAILTAAIPTTTVPTTASCKATLNPTTGWHKNRATLSHCKYSENSMTELRGNW